ncbi:hypothetical protein MASR2M18_12520 [Ignavibacteria bacterium]
MRLLLQGKKILPETSKFDCEQFRHFSIQVKRTLRIKFAHSGKEKVFVPPKIGTQSSKKNYSYVFWHEIIVI